MDEAIEGLAGSTGGERDLERRNRELSVLTGIARELNRSVDPDQALRFVLSQVAELLGLQTGWVWLMDEDSPEPYLAAAKDLPPALTEDPRRMDGSGYCYCLDTYKRGDLEGAANVNVDRKSTRLNSSHANISYAVFCLKKKKQPVKHRTT